MSSVPEKNRKPVIQKHGINQTALSQFHMRRKAALMTTCINTSTRAGALAVCTGYAIGGSGSGSCTHAHAGIHATTCSGACTHTAGMSRAVGGCINGCGVGCCTGCIVAVGAAKKAHCQSAEKEYSFHTICLLKVQKFIRFVLQLYCQRQLVLKINCGTDTKPAGFRRACCAGFVIFVLLL